LHSYRQVKQTGFTPHRSTIGGIITLQLLLQTGHEYCRPLWIAYVDLKSAFDNVNCEALWLLLLSLGLPPKRVVVPGLFLTPMNWLLNYTDQLAFLGTTVDTEAFTDLDFADDVDLLTEMLSVLVLALYIMNYEAKFLGFQINCLKTIQTTDASF